MQERQALVALNARIRASLRRHFDIAVARRGLTKQTAVEEALRMWISKPPSSGRPMTEAPLIQTKRRGILNLTPQEMDDILLG